MKHKAHVLNTAILVLVLAAAAAAQSTKIVQLRLDAEQGDAHAQNSLGFMYDTGQGVPQDSQEAERWYRLAAEQGHAYAQYNLGVMYIPAKAFPREAHGTASHTGFPRRPGARTPRRPCGGTASQRSRVSPKPNTPVRSGNGSSEDLPGGNLAAEQVDFSVPNTSGSYDTGTSLGLPGGRAVVPPRSSPMPSLGVTKPAVRAGLSRGSCGGTASQREQGRRRTLELMYSRRKRENGNPRMRLYHIAADTVTQHCPIQSLVLVMYDTGQGVPQDLPGGVRWYRLAAEQGDAHAQYSLGVMYNTGHRRSPGLPGGHAVVPPRSRAGERPMPNTTLGSCTPTAKASPRTTSKPTRGLTWPLHERLQGKREDFRLARDSLAERMTASQVAEAQRLAREWQPKTWEQLTGK